MPTCKYCHSLLLIGIGHKWWISCFWLRFLFSSSQQPSRSERQRNIARWPLSVSSHLDLKYCERSLVKTLGSALKTQEQPEVTYKSSQFLRQLTHSHQLTLRTSIECFLVLRDWLATRYNITALKLLNIFTEEVDHFHSGALFLLP